MKVTVFGIAYVGLVQGAVLAEVGHGVVCVDVDTDKVEGLQQGQIQSTSRGFARWLKTTTRLAGYSFARSSR